MKLRKILQNFVVESRRGISYFSFLNYYNCLAHRPTTTVDKAGWNTEQYLFQLFNKKIFVAVRKVEMIA